MLLRLEVLVAHNDQKQTSKLQAPAGFTKNISLEFPGWRAGSFNHIQIYLKINKPLLLLGRAALFLLQAMREETASSNNDMFQPLECNLGS